MALPKKNKVDVNSLIDDSPQVQVDVMSLIDDGGEKKNRVGNGSGSGTPVIPPSPSPSPSKSTFGGSNFSLDPTNLLNKEQEEPLLPQPRKREITPANLKEQKSFEQELFGISKYGTKTLRIDRGNIVNGVEAPEEIEIDPRTIPVSPYKNVTDDVFLGNIRYKLLQNQPLSKQEESFIRKNKNPVSKFTSDDDNLLQGLSGELGLAAEAIRDAKVPDLIGSIFPQIKGKTFGDIANSNEGKYSQIQTVKEKIKRDIEIEESKRTGEKGETSDYETLAKLNSQLEDITALERKVSRRLAAVGEAGVEGTSRTDNTGSNWERFKKSAANLLFMGSAFIPEKPDEDIELKVSQLPSQLITGLNYTKYAEPVEFERVSRALAQGKPISETQIANLTNIGIDIEKERLKEDYNELKIDKPTFDAKSMELSIKSYDNLVGNKEVLRGFLSSGIADVLDEIETTKIQNNITGSREFGQVFGMRWQYTDEEIDYAAKVVAKANGLNIDDPRVKEAIQYLQDNEGAMIMQNSISKSGFTRDFFKGAAMPIRGIASTIEGVGKTSEEIYAEGQSQGNVNVSETPVKRIANSWEGTVGKVFEGAGQLGTQIGLSYLTGGAIGGAGKAILGRGGVAALEGEIALADMAAADLAGAGLYKGREFISTFMTSFGTTYDGKLKEAQTYTADDGKAMAVAGGLAGMEGVVETFLSPLDIARGVGKGLFGKSSTQKLINILDDAKILDKKSAIQEYLKGTLKAGLASGKMIASEIGEEEVIALSSYGANAMLNPNSESFQNRVLKDELFETGIQTGLSMVIPALFTGVGAFNTNNFAKGSLIIAAQNRQMMVDALDKNLADGLVTQDEYNKKLQIVNSAAKANQELPLKADGSKLNSEEKANYIFSRVSEGALERKIEVSTDEAEKTILRNKIAEEQKSRETILNTPTNVQTQTTQNVSTQAQNNQGQQGQDNQTQNATPTQDAEVVIDEQVVDIVTPEGFTNRVFESNMQLGEAPTDAHISEEGFNYRVLSQNEIDAIRESGGVFAREGKQKGGNKNTKYWTKGNKKNWYGDKDNLETIRVNQNNFSENEVVRAANVEVYNKETGRFEPLIKSQTTNTNTNENQESNTEGVLGGLREEGNKNEGGQEGQQLRKEEMTVAQLRAEEQKELAAAIPNIESYKVDGVVDETLITDETERKAFDEIYGRYDKLITPKLEEEQRNEEVIKVNELVGNPITYKGQRATIVQDGQALVVKINGSNREYELGNVNEVGNASIKEFGIEQEQTVVGVNESDQITVRDTPFVNNFSDPLQAINYDENGNVLSVNLETVDGKKRTFRGNVAEDIAYQISLKEINKNNETREQFEQFATNDAAVAAEINDGENAVATQAEADANNQEVSRTAATRTFAEEIISDDAYNNFIDNNIVDNDTIVSIANKVKNRQQLSERENAIFVGKTGEINKEIKKAEIERRRQEELSKIIQAIFPNTQLNQVVYHGTRTQEKFENFDENKIGELDSGYFGRGFYFSPDKSYADGYAKQYNGYTIAAILNLQNPLETDANKANSNISLENNDGAIVRAGENITPELNTTEYDANEIGEVVVKNANQIHILSEKELNNIDKINAKYDAELADLEKSQSTAKEQAQSTLKTEQDAIQEQTAGEVPVQSRATVGETMEEGIPQAEPQSVAQEGEAKKEEGSVANPALQDVESTTKALEELYDKGESIIIEDRDIVYDTAETINFVDGKKVKALRASQTTGVYLPLDKLAERYHDAKSKGIENDLTKAIESLLSEEQTKPTEETQQQTGGATQTQASAATTTTAPPKTADAIKKENEKKIEDFNNKVDANAKSLIDFLTPKGMEAEQAAPAAKSKGVSVNNKSAISALEGKSKGKNKIIISAAKKAIKTLQSIFPDMDIVLHEDTDSYNEAMGLVNGGINTAGNFAYESDAKNSPTGRGRIDINLSMANARTVAHEVAHAIMLKKFGENPALFKNFRDKIAKILNESSNKALMDFANQYVDKQGNLLDVTYEEYLAELTGALSAGEGSISSTTLQKIAALINEVVSKLTNGVLKPFEDIKDTKQVVDFFSGISSVIREGKDVNTLSEDFSGLLYEPTPLNVTGTINNPLPSTNRKPTSKSSRGDFNLIPHPIIDKNTMVGKKYSVTMSDHTKVGEYKNEKTGVTVKDLMGGVFYPYIKGVKDAGIAWASVTTKAAREMVMNAVNQDVTLIYRMSRATGSRGNVNFNEIAFAELIAPVTNGTVTEKEFLSNLNNKLNTIANGTQLATGIYILGKYGVDTNEKISINKTKIVKVKDKNGKLVDKTIKVTDKNGDNVRVKVTKKEIPSLDALKKALSKESFSKRGGFWSTILKDSWSTKSTGEWYKFLEKNKVTSLEEIVNNLAEPEVDNANDHDVVAAIKIAPPEYDKNGNVKIYTTRKNLVNEEKGVYFIDAPNHPSYPYVVKGSPIGVLNEFNSIADYFPIINEWIKSGRLNSPYKAVETMGKELVEKLDPSQTTFANTTMVSKAQVVYDETGFISVPSMIEIVKSNDPTYLGGVMEHIEGMGKKLRTGRVNATDVAKSYLMAVSSIRSGDIGVDKFENSVGKNVDEVFLEPNNKIRTEGAMAFLLTTDEGKRFLKNVESGKIDTKDRTFISTAMKPFGMFGVGESKFENIFGKPSEKQINLTNINEFNSLLKGGVKNESELFDAVVKLKGISQAKVGFVSNFLGVGTRGVIDAREIQGWLRGSVFQGKRTVQEAEIEKQLTKSNKSLSDLQQEILKRMRIVGEAFGVNPLLAEYIGHHMIWDAVAKEKTTHDGLYLAMTQNENDFNDKLNKITSKSQKEGEANPALKDVESTAKDTFENREKIEDGLKELGSDVYYHGSSDISYLNSKDDISTIYNTKNAKSKYLNLSPKAGVAVSYSISEQKIGEKSGVAAFKLKGKGYTMKNSDINNLKTNEAYEAFYDNKKAEGYDYVKVPQDANDIVVLNNNAIDYVDKKLNSESLLSKEQTENNGATATAANQPVSTTEGTTQQQGGQEAVQQGTTDAGQGGATTATTVQPNTDDAVKKATTSKSQEANPASVADIVNEASKIIKTAYAASQNVKEAVQKGLDYFIANWNENELGELPVEALRARLEAEFEVETEKTVKEVADDVRNDKISYNDAIEGKSDTFISELDKELFGSSKFSFEEQAFKEGVRRQKMAGLTEQEISDNYAALKKLTKRQKEIISEVFLETAQSDKMAKELQEAFASLAEGQKPKSVLERLAVSDVTALVNALKNALTYNAISNKQLEEMADFIVNAIDLKDADKYINALISREVADVRQLVRAKLIVKLQDLGNNELATQLINEMADEATLSGRQTQSLIKAYEILNAKGNPSTKAAFQKRYADAVQKQAREMNKDLSKALTDKEVEIGRLNERLHQATQKSSKMSKLKEVIAKLCGLRNK